MRRDPRFGLRGARGLSVLPSFFFSTEWRSRSSARSKIAAGSPEGTSRHSRFCARCSFSYVSFDTVNCNRYRSGERRAAAGRADIMGDAKPAAGCAGEPGARDDAGVVADAAEPDGSLSVSNSVFVASTTGTPTFRIVEGTSGFGSNRATIISTSFLLRWRASARTPRASPSRNREHPHDGDIQGSVRQPLQDLR